jgi:predicted Zn finger-like uncharacterized protein
MPVTIACPHCQRQLKVQDANLGRPVRCPACQQVFTAAEPPPPPVEEDVPDVSAFQVAETAPERAPRRREPDDPLDFEAPARRRALEDDEDDYDGGRPHRGGLILTLGILTLFFSLCCPLVCWIIGGIGLNMAGSDLRAMSRREMDRSGRGLTQTGKTLMNVGVAIGVANAVLGVILRLSGAFR